MFNISVKGSNEKAIERLEAVMQSSLNELLKPIKESMEEMSDKDKETIETLFEGYNALLNAAMAVQLEQARTLDSILSGIEDLKKSFKKK